MLAAMASSIVNAIVKTMGGKKAKTIKLDRFIPSWLKKKKKTKAQSGEEMLAQMVKITKAYGGKDLRNNG